MPPDPCPVCGTEASPVQGYDPPVPSLRSEPTRITHGTMWPIALFGFAIDLVGVFVHGQAGWFMLGLGAGTWGVALGCMIGPRP